MSRSKHKKRKQNGMPLVALIGLLIGLFSFFLAAEGILYLRPHPWHWGIMLIGAALGYGAGMVWYRTRGDVI